MRSEGWGKRDMFRGPSATHDATLHHHAPFPREPSRACSAAYVRSAWSREFGGTPFFERSFVTPDRSLDYNRKPTCPLGIRSPVPNITDVEGHVVRCEYDGAVRLCSKYRLPGHERKKCATPWCEHAVRASHLRRTLKALRWGSPSTPLQAEAVFGGNHAVQCAAGRASNRGQCRGSGCASAYDFGQRGAERNHSGGTGRSQGAKKRRQGAKTSRGSSHRFAKAFAQRRHIRASTKTRRGAEKEGRGSPHRVS
ncbi:hypothetical protein HPB51_019993 [Rhipicephalus microplus]|uniref:Uncharacterized protein n=1 Tax=Rhipicephalus microplus TaxID=6941 RepID=A0A9J6E3C1_RHIMP|nr:hypothetical protein HPB51_019993 [Rhipicephalus microplus]